MIQYNTRGTYVRRGEGCNHKRDRRETARLDWILHKIGSKNVIFGDRGRQHQVASPSDLKTAREDGSVQVSLSEELTVILHMQPSGLGVQQRLQIRTAGELRQRGGRGGYGGGVTILFASLLGSINVLLIVCHQSHLETLQRRYSACGDY